tara:strand:- start:113 stop:883 length:771 start_codon:yes stop_codon:yes gene_type:complete
MATKLKNNWEFDVLGIYNYNNFGSFDGYLKFIKKNHKKIKGDLLEAGVFRGKSLLSIALYLKKIKSKKKIYAFDTWEGFPKNLKKNYYDEYDRWKDLLKLKMISKSHYEDVLKNRKYVVFNKKVNKSKLNSFNLSTSGDFSSCSIKDIKRKIKFLKLDNIILIKGPFSSTMKQKKLQNLKLFSAIIDSDLYDSYKIALPFIWKRLQKKGIIFLDEYYSLKFPGARIACNDFFKKNKIKPKMFKKRNHDFERYYIEK